jgi:hypothetical protein
VALLTADTIKIAGNLNKGRRSTRCLARALMTRCGGPPKRRHMAAANPTTVPLLKAAFEAVEVRDPEPGYPLIARSMSSPATPSARDHEAGGPAARVVRAAAAQETLA